MPIFTRIREVLSRYLAAEVAGTLAALAGFWAAHRMGAVSYLAGHCGGAAETAGFYGVILVNEWRRNGRPTRRSLRGLLVEFGPAEVLDTVVTRPFLLAIGPALLNDVPTGVVAGKVAADIVFYAIAVPSRHLYERWSGRSPAATPAPAAVQET